ncbi:hypothetical protein ACIRVF_30650 [Kitasatospora sp. NPDC101157]|uniref:hypothetical protein n=1 Tax=Kitasatospora sp. NPDC101157 TaxID=3364098 RepID=UPI0038181165
MSVDASLSLRWPEGLAPGTDGLARLLGLDHGPGHGPDAGPWSMTTTPDGRSRMWVRIATDPADRTGPYDHWLHLSPPGSPPHAEDTHAVLRAHCRETVALLRRHGLAEAAHDIDGDPTGYWTRAAEHPELLTDPELTVWWAAEAPTTATLPAALTPNLRPAPTTQRAPAPTDDLGAHAAELPVQHTARFTGHRVTSGELDTFADRLVATLTRPGERIDVALRLHTRLIRYESAIQPPTDLRVLP